ncbi:MAG TPA: 23S rRNA (uracil(1939)-C(5))-methyltransferase RlmD [Edaphobacter sp.]|nr:23S rRNA (uracil(1939)-C(5))-methyltransferase RlmD [Edaphobacter sp.]
MRLQIEKAVYGGAGLAHQTEGEGAGKAIFVPFTLPGEIVEARLLEQKNAFGEASLLQVLIASEDRVTPRCAHFGQCGGCHYQHAAYPAQVQMKVAILQETLERVGLSTLPAIQTHTGEPWAYRNRTRLRMAEIEATLRVGYNRRGSNEFLAVHECPISAPLVWRAAEALLTVAAEGSAAGRLLRGAGEVEFFTTGDEKKLQMTLFVRKVQPGFEALCERMQELVPEIVGAGISLLPSSEPQRRVRSPRPLKTWGADGLNYTVADEGYWISRGGFFQVNRFLVDELVRIVTAGRRGAVAWDLYAGVGLFSRALARTFEQVVAVEAAGHDLSISFKGPGRRAVETTTVEFLRNAVVQRERPELIVMDPPRAGVGAEVCALLARISPPEIVYVSCDPVTLARDLKLLVAAGYNIAEVHMVDMFPQTFHLETVTILGR